MSGRVGVACAVVLALRGGSLEAQSPPRCPDDPAFQALDFWVGDWTVWSEGQQVGTNRIVKVQDGCSIEEHWVDAEGRTGQSLFYYLPAVGEWKQVWVTPAARLAGGIKEKAWVEAPGGSVRFQGTIARDDGSTYLDRTTLTSRTDGTVRQHIEVSMDGGASWRTTFDAEYRPTIEASAVDAPSPEEARAPFRVAHPDWSPDGRWLAFEADWAGSPDVWIMRLDGTGARRLTSAPEMESYPRFSPDGGSVAFLRRGPSGFTVQLVDVDTGVERPLRDTVGDLEAAFSPDGRSVALRSYLGGRDDDGEIVVADLAGGAARQLTDNAVEDGFPSYGPDGRWLYFHARSTDTGR